MATWLIEHQIDVPAKRQGVSGWETWWRHPGYRNVINILKEPTYAGAYAYGRTETRTQVRNGEIHKTRVRKPLEQWTVLIPDHHDGYISWERFQRIQSMLEDNASGFQTPRRRGAPKRGAALLAGLLRCRRCGRKLMVAYSGKNASVPRYQCHRGRLDTLEAKCLSFGGTSADAAVSNELLQVVRPGAIEAAVLAETQKQDIRAQRARALNLEVDEARYSAERAGRQYEASDPENRLVTAELERRWNAALQKAQELEAKAAKERCHDPSSCPDLASLGNLALDLEAVWLSHETDVRLKKRLIRALIEEVVVEVDEDRCEVELLIHWKGGLHSKQRIPRRRRGQGGPRTSTDVIDAVRQLAHLCRDKAIAGYLNRNGHLTARGHRWSRMSVTSLRTGQSIPVYSPETQDAAGWMNLTNAAAHLAIAPKTLRRAAEQGEIVALHPLKHGPWVFSRTDLDDPAFRRRMKARLSGQIPPTGPDLRQLNLMNSTTYRGEIL